MTRTSRRARLPATFRDYLTKILPLSTTEHRTAVERLLFGIVAHQERWAGLQRCTAREQLSALRGHCDICDAPDGQRKLSAQVPIQMADSIVDCLLVAEDFLAVAQQLRQAVRPRADSGRIKHWSIKDYCRDVEQEDWPAGYLEAFIRGMKDLTWDFDDAQYPRWVLEGADAVFSSRYMPEAAYTWRPLLPHDGRVQLNCTAVHVRNNLGASGLPASTLAIQKR